mgnify:CR=1 FL=1
MARADHGRTPVSVEQPRQPSGSSQGGRWSTRRGSPAADKVLSGLTDLDADVLFAAAIDALEDPLLDAGRLLALRRSPDPLVRLMACQREDVPLPFEDDPDPIVAYAAASRLDAFDAETAETLGRTDVLAVQRLIGAASA